MMRALIPRVPLLIPAIPLFVGAIGFYNSTGSGITDHPLALPSGVQPGMVAVYVQQRGNTIGAAAPALGASAATDAVVEGFINRASTATADHYSGTLFTKELDAADMVAGAGSTPAIIIPTVGTATGICGAVFWRYRGRLLLLDPANDTDPATSGFARSADANATSLATTDFTPTRRGYGLRFCTFSGGLRSWTPPDGWTILSSGMAGSVASARYAVVLAGKVLQPDVATGSDPWVCDLATRITSFPMVAHG